MTCCIVQLNGNAIGKTGARALVRAAASCGDSVATVIGMEDCNMALEGGKDFDPSSPGGEYHLDVAQPYERCVAIDLLRLAAVRNGCTIESAKIGPSETHPGVPGESTCGRGCCCYTGS